MIVEFMANVTESDDASTWLIRKKRRAFVPWETSELERRLSNPTGTGTSKYAKYANKIPKNPT